jgi:hypothetical protein
VHGFADPAFRFLDEFHRRARVDGGGVQGLPAGFHPRRELRVTAPLGQYDSAKLVNVGTNRWSFKPEIGFSKAFGRWTVEVAPAATLYTHNGDFFGGQTRKVKPIYSAQGARQLHVRAGRLAGVECGLLRGRPLDHR